VVVARAGQDMVQGELGRDSGWAAVGWVGAEAVAQAQAEEAREPVAAVPVRVAGACGSPAVAEADKGLVERAEGQVLGVVLAGMAVEELAQALAVVVPAAVGAGE
jgi:hypothetical protein